MKNFWLNKIKERLQKTVERRTIEKLRRDAIQKSLRRFVKK
jgi:hypothetical protein